MKRILIILLLIIAVSITAKLGLGLGLGLERRRGATRDNYSLIKLFQSDGTIIDGKLYNTIGSQDYSPSLVESNCLQIEVDDTIEFTDLSGWSLVSNGGTAVVEVSGNTIICTTAGTLYNMILSDGSNNHTYPLAEGYYTIAYDTYPTPVNGTINCASLVWTTQDTYHKNVEGNTYTNSHTITFTDNNLVDAGSGLPTGYSLYATYGNIATTAGGVTRVTVPVGGHSSYYKHEIRKLGCIEAAKDYKAKIRIRRSSGTATSQIRFGSSGAADYITVTTDWQTIETDIVTSDDTYIKIIGGMQTAGDWFEFSMVEVTEATDDYLYIPKRDLATTDANGTDLTVVGNGYFIDCETKIKFPDETCYQTIESDINLGFMYDQAGDQRSISYDELYTNYLSLDRIFTTKTDGRLTEMIVVNPLLTTRNTFVSFLNSINSPTALAYTKITKGALIYWNLNHWVYTDPYDDFIDILLERGNAPFGGMISVGYDTNKETEWLAFVANGGSFYVRPIMYYGNTSFELADGEAEQFATEITDGDLITVDAPDSKTGAYPDITFPDFTVVGELKTTTKQSGTCIVDNTDLAGYGNALWIPAGQSGVPSEFEEVPLWMHSAVGGDDDGKLKFFMWPADDYFSATFSNVDSINIYTITYQQYGSLFNANGLKCTMIHNRNLYANINSKLRASGYLENASSDLMTSDVGTLAFWDSKMLFGSNSGYIYTNISTIMDNQDTPRLWCGHFGHTTLNTAEDLDDFLATVIPSLVDNNEIKESDFNGYSVDTTEKFQSIIDKCDSEGVLFFTPIDLIKNIMFNDYNGNDFFTGE